MDSLREVVAGRGQGNRPPPPKRQWLGILEFLLVLSLFGPAAAPAFASTAEEINALPTLDALNRSEEILSNSGKWSVLAWDSSTTGHSTGRDTTSGWGPFDAFPTVNGAFWNPATFSDKTGDAAAITMQAGPEISERYAALWLNMSNPGSAKTGYQLGWTLNSNLSTYTVTLSKWSAGTQTVLATNSSVAIPGGTTLAISDTGGTVTAWQGTGSSLSSLLSAADTTYTSGYAGIEGSGNISRSINFKAGNLAGSSGTAPDTTILGGPKGVVVPNVQFSFSATEPGSSFECALDSAVFGACTSPKAYPGLAEGSRTFRVRATGAGGADQTPAERGFQVVTAAKATSKVAVLDNLERQEVPLATGKWSKSSWAGEIGGAWTGSYRGYGASAGLAGAYWNPTTFSDGEGTVLVAGTVGTGSVPSGQYSALLLNMPNPSSARSGYEARFTGTGSATNYTVELAKWVSGTRTVLASTAGFSLPVGTTMVLTETTGGSLALWTGTTSLSAVLSASDSTYTSGYAGLEVNGGAGTVYNFRAGRIDLQAPDTTITSGPTGTVLPANVSFAFSSTESGSSFECSLDGAAYSACSSPKTYPTIAGGAHTFRVRATDPVGNQDETPAERSFQVLSPPAATTASATGIGGNTATLKATVNPNGGETTYQFEYGTTTAYGSKVPVSAKAIGSGSANVEVSEVIGSLSTDTTYHYRITATNGAGTSKGEDGTFTTAGVPIGTTEGATGISASEATLNATVNPKGAETTYQFEYGTTTAYGTKVPASAKAIGSGVGAVQVTQVISGLTQGTTYHFRVVAQNSVGTTYGSDATFATPVLADATTQAATSVNSNEAILNSTVDPNGSAATYLFEYGATSSYGLTAPAAAEEGLTGTQPVEADEALAHLEPSTTYHYRVVATSQAGVVKGADKTFTTAASTVTPQQEAEERAEELHFTGKFAAWPSEDFFGLQWTGDFREVKPNEMEALRRSGTKVLRLAIWDSVSAPDPNCLSEHKGNGPYCWTTYDLIFERAANRGIGILPYFGGGPLPTGAAIASWEAFVQAAVNRYGIGGSFWTRIDAAKRQPVFAWEVWNEPNVAGNGVGGVTVDPVAFGNFLGTMASVIRTAAGSGNSQIVVGGLLSVRPYKSGDPEPHLTVGEFLQAMDHHGAYDAIGLHPYAFAAGETPNGDKYPPTGPGGVETVVGKVRANIRLAREALDSPGMEGKDKKIWITEIGWPVQTFDATHLAVAPTVARELLEGTFEMARATRERFGLRQLIYFNYHDILDHPEEDKKEGWARRAGLKAIDEHFRPAWYGFQSEMGMPKWPNNPRVFTKSPEVRSSTANLIAGVDPLGSESVVWFKYGATTNYGTATPAVSAGFEEGEVDRSIPISGLTPNTQYHVVAVAQNENGEKEEGTDVGFTTAPIQETTATVTEHLNGEPGWASVAGWSKYEGVGLDGLKVRVNFLKSDGSYVYRDATLSNGQYHVDNVPLGRGTWETWSVFLAQAGYPQSSSGYHQIVIKNGYKLIAKHSTKCLDVNQGNIGNGAPMIQYQCGSPQSALNQIFTLVPVDDQHHYQLVARHSNRCVGVTAGSQQPGVQLSQYDCLGPAYTHQIWKSESVLPNGPENSYNRFVAQNSGQCMEVQGSSAADGGIVDQYGCAGTQANQLWTFESVEADQVPTQTFLTIDKNDTYHGMPGFISFHGRLDIAGRAYPLAGRVVHVIFERQNAQGGFEPVPGEEYNATLNSAGEFTYRYWGIGHDTWHIRAVFYGTGDALGKSESETHTEVIKSGYRLMFRSSQKCLSTYENHTANGTMLIQWTCDPNWNPWDGQTFSLYPVAPIGSNHWQLRPNTAYGQCVDVYGTSTANGAPLNLYQCTPGATNQVWSFPELGSPNIGWFGGVALHSNKCMDVTAGNPANGVQIEQYECVWNGNQQFAWQVVP